MLAKFRVIDAKTRSSGTLQVNKAHMYLTIFQSISFYCRGYSDLPRARRFGVQTLGRARDFLTRALSQGQRGGGAALTIHPHLTPRLMKE